MCKDLLAGLAGRAGVQARDFGRCIDPGEAVVERGSWDPTSRMKGVSPLRVQPRLFLSFSICLRGSLSLSAHFFADHARKNVRRKKAKKRPEKPRDWCACLS